MSVDPLYDASSTTVQNTVVACITDLKLEPSHLQGLIERTGPAVFFQAAFVEGNKGQRVEINIVVDLQQTSQQKKMVICARENPHSTRRLTARQHVACTRLHNLCAQAARVQSDIHHIHPTVRLELMQVP